MEVRGPGQATPFVREEAPTAPGNGIPGDGGSVPPSPPSGRGDFVGGSDIPTDSSSSSGPSSRSSDAGGAGGPGGEAPSDPGGDGGSGGDPGDSENLEELKYDPADDRYPGGLEGKKLLWGASNAGPLRHGLESGRTRKQTREMQGAGEMPGPGETPEPEEALLATILETGGTGIVEDYICNSLVKEQWQEEQTRGMEEMYRREMQEVLGPEQQAFRAEVDASESSQPLPDPQLSMTSPIGQKPSDVEAVPMTYKNVMWSKYKEEQTRGMEEMYRREMQEVLGPEQQAFRAEVDASESSQPLPDPQLSMTSPIGQKPSDVEAVPMTYKNVMWSKYKVFWQAAMKKEIDDHDKTGTFTKVKELPERRKAIGSKWVFSWKTNEKGLIVDFKARVVARGLSQIPGIDFYHSSSACPSAASIKTVIAVATEKGKKVAHWDVKQAADPCVFRKVVDGEVEGLVVIHVDDILVAADEGEREELFASLNKKFPVKDLGECIWYDGCAIAMDVEMTSPSCPR
ncbi:unnamed protein product [Ectocarpus sp. CCAP 1310/34]|nr:unnamed protein product [Ectocarpus sp. CCAP 1310/34]